MTPLPKFLRAQRIRFGFKRTISFHSSDPILMYHNVVNEADDAYNLRTHLAHDFEKQIKFLHKLRSSKSSVRKEDPTTRIEVTFDDGLANNYHIARPILEKYEMPATFFVSTENIDSTKLLWPDELEWLCKAWNKPIWWNNEKFSPHPIHGIYVSADNKRLSHELKRTGPESFLPIINQMKISVGKEMPGKMVELYRTMNSSEIKELSDHPLFTVGSHSHHHIPLVGKPPAYQQEELSLSKKILESITGQVVKKVAFPDGSYDQETIDIAAKVGFEVLYGVHHNDKYPHVKSRTGLYTDEPWFYQLAF